MRIVAALLLVLAVSCREDAPVDADPESNGLSSCDRAANRLNEVCGELAGEDYRALCEVTEFPFYTEQDMACVARLSECNEAAFDACNVRSVTIVCSPDNPCPAPLACDHENEECARCLEHGDCAAGRGCLMGLCYDEDSEFFRRLSALFARDGGAGSEP
jgi:hypothetical protein